MALLFEPRLKPRIIIINDPGPDPDAVKCILVAAMLHKKKEIELSAVVCNGSARPEQRATLARRVLDLVGEPEIPVGIGARGEAHAVAPHEFALDGYDKVDGRRLESAASVLEAVLRAAPPRSVRWVLASAMTDFASFARESTELVVSRTHSVSVMGGLKARSAGQYGWTADSSNNNEKDRAAATATYDWCFEHRVGMSVIGRDAVPMLPMQLARSFAAHLDSSLIEYLARAQLAALNGLWQRLCAGELPARNTKLWFFTTFCGVSTAEYLSGEYARLGAADDVSEHLNGLVKAYQVAALVMALPGSSSVFVSRGAARAAVVRVGGVQHRLLMRAEHALDPSLVLELVRDTLHDVARAQREARRGRRVLSRGVGGGGSGGVGGVGGKRAKHGAHRRLGGGPLAGSPLALLARCGGGGASPVCGGGNARRSHADGSEDGRVSGVLERQSSWHLETLRRSSGVSERSPPLSLDETRELLDGALGTAHVQQHRATRAASAAGVLLMLGALVATAAEPGLGAAWRGAAARHAEAELAPRMLGYLLLLAVGAHLTLLGIFPADALLPAARRGALGIAAVSLCYVALLVLGKAVVLSTAATRVEAGPEPRARLARAVLALAVLGALALLAAGAALRHWRSARALLRGAWSAVGAFGLGLGALAGLHVATTELGQGEAAVLALIGALHAALGCAALTPAWRMRLQTALSRAVLAPIARAAPRGRQWPPAPGGQGRAKRGTVRPAAQPGAMPDLLPAAAGQRAHAAPWPTATAAAGGPRPADAAAGAGGTASGQPQPQQPPRARAGAHAHEAARPEHIVALAPLLGFGSARAERQPAELVAEAARAFLPVPLEDSVLGALGGTQPLAPAALAPGGADGARARAAARASERSSAAESVVAVGADDAALDLRIAARPSQPGAFGSPPKRPSALLDASSHDDATRMAALVSGSHWRWWANQPTQRACFGGVGAGGGAGRAGGARASAADPLLPPPLAGQLSAPMPARFGRSGRANSALSMAAAAGGAPDRRQARSSFDGLWRVGREPAPEQRTRASAGGGGGGFADEPGRPRGAAPWAGAAAASGGAAALPPWHACVAARAARARSGEPRRSTSGAEGALAAPSALADELTRASTGAASSAQQSESLNSYPSAGQLTAASSALETPAPADYYVVHSDADPASARADALRLFAQRFERQHGRRPTVWIDALGNGAWLSRVSALEHTPCRLALCRGVLVLASTSLTRKLHALIEVHTWHALGGRADAIEVEVVAPPPEPTPRESAASCGCDSRRESTRERVRGSAGRWSGAAVAHANRDVAAAFDAFHVADAASEPSLPARVGESVAKRASASTPRSRGSWASSERGGGALGGGGAWWAARARLSTKLDHAAEVTRRLKLAVELATERRINREVRALVPLVRAAAARARQQQDRAAAEATAAAAARGSGAGGGGGAESGRSVLRSPVSKFIRPLRASRGEEGAGASSPPRPRPKLKLKSNGAGANGGGRGRAELIDLEEGGASAGKAGEEA